MVLYEAVTADAFELPLVVEQNVEALAFKTGYSVNVIQSSISHGDSGRARGMRFVRVCVDDFPDDGPREFVPKAPVYEKCTPEELARTEPIVTWVFAKPPEKPKSKLDGAPGWRDLIVRCDE